MALIGATNAGIYEIQTRFMKLLFTLIHASNKSFSTVQTDLANVTVKVDRQTMNGPIPLIPQMSLLHLMEISAANEGIVQHTADATNGTKLIGSVEFSEHGSITCSDNEQFEVSVSTLPAGYSLQLNTIDAPAPAAEIFDYKIVPFRQSVPKEISVVGSTWLALRDDLLQLLSLTFPDGTKNTFTRDEARAIVDEINGAAYISNGTVKSGYNNFIVFPVASAIRADVTYSADGNAYTVNTKPL